MVLLLTVNRINVYNGFWGIFQTPTHPDATPMYSAYCSKTFVNERARIAKQKAVTMLTSQTIYPPYRFERVLLICSEHTKGK